MVKVTLIGDAAAFNLIREECTEGNFKVQRSTMSGDVSAWKFDRQTAARFATRVFPISTRLFGFMSSNSRFIRLNVAWQGEIAERSRSAARCSQLCSARLRAASLDQGGIGANIRIVLWKFKDEIARNETKSRSEGIIPGVIATIRGDYSRCMNGRGGVQYINNFERAGSRSRSNELICAEDRQQFARNWEKNIMAGIPVRPRSWKLLRKLIVGH